MHARSQYSTNKTEATLLTRRYWATYRFPVVYTGETNTYDLHQYPHQCIRVVTNALEALPLPLYGVGKRGNNLIASQAKTLLRFVHDRPVKRRALRSASTWGAL